MKRRNKINIVPTPSSIENTIPDSYTESKDKPGWLIREKQSQEFLKEISEESNIDQGKWAE